MRELVRDLVRWHEQQIGVRKKSDGPAYQRVQDRLRDIEIAQRQASIPVQPWFQTELGLQGPAGGIARGRLLLRHRDCRGSQLRFVPAQPALAIGVRPRSDADDVTESEFEITIDLAGVSRGRHEQAVDVFVDAAFRIRIWLTIEVT